MIPLDAELTPQYWPDVLNIARQYDDIEVKLLAVRLP
jgi:hypothetical protein